MELSLTFLSTAFYDNMEKYKVHGTEIVSRHYSYHGRKNRELLRPPKRKWRIFEVGHFKTLS